VPELNLLLATCPAIRWEEAGFWPKFLFYLPPSSALQNQAVSSDKNVLFPNRSPHNNNGSGGGLSSDNSTASTKSTGGNGTPREQSKQQQTQQHHGLMNPLEQWSDASDSGYGVTKDHIYQTLGGYTGHTIHAQHKEILSMIENSIYHCSECTIGGKWKIDVLLSLVGLNNLTI
jgi:hypothetical protein